MVGFHPGRASSRRCARWLLAAAVASTGLLAGTSAFAADPYPNHAIRLLVGFTPGTATDIIARQLAERLTRDNGWTVVVDNKPGQAGSLAASEVARSAPDGYTLLITANGPMATNPAMYSNVKYDATRDFTAIGKVAVLPYVLAVTAGSPVKDLKELLAAAQARPGALNYGSPGIGSTSHLITAMFATKTGIQLTHIPYKGSPEVITSLLSGSLDLIIDTSVVTVPLIRSGKLRPLAVTTAERIPVLPEVPTLIESGYALDMGAWLGIVAPAGLPPDMIRTLNKAIRAAAESPETREKFAQNGTLVSTSTPEEFSRFIAGEVVKWGDAVRESGARSD